MTVTPTPPAVAGPPDPGLDVVGPDERPDIVAYVVLEHGIARSGKVEAELVAHVHDTIGGLARPSRIVYVESLTDVPGYRFKR